MVALRFQTPVLLDSVSGGHVNMLGTPDGQSVHSWLFMMRFWYVLILLFHVHMACASRFLETILDL